MTALGPGEWTVPWRDVDGLSLEAAIAMLNRQGLWATAINSKGIRVCWRRTRYRRFRDWLVRWVS